MRNRVAIKAEARRLIQQGHVSPILAAAVVLVTGFVLDRLLDLVEGGSLFASYQYRWAYYQAAASGDIGSVQAVLDLVPEATITSMSMTIAVYLITTVLNGGFYLFCMSIRRREDTPLATLLDGLSCAGRLIWCSIQMGVRIFLWSMLFFFPGIIAAYRYRFAIFNVLSDPEISAGDAIRRSCEQTRGMKWELFVLDLSFFGWMLLSSLTLGLLNLWITPYMTLCDLAYYDAARQELGGNGWQ